MNPSSSETDTQATRNAQGVFIVGYKDCFGRAASQNTLMGLNLTETGRNGLKSGLDSKNLATVFQSALAFDSDNPLAHALLGHCLLESGDLIGAETHLDKALKLYEALPEDVRAVNKPDYAHAVARLGRVELLRGKYDKADEYLRRAEALHPASAVVMRNIARLNARRVAGENDEQTRMNYWRSVVEHAAASCRHMTEQERQNTDYRQEMCALMAEGYYETGRYSEAATLAESVLIETARLNGTANPEYKLALQTTLALAYIELDRPQAAAQVLDQIDAASPRNPLASYGRAKMLAREAKSLDGQAQHLKMWEAVTKAAHVCQALPSDSRLHRLADKLKYGLIGEIDALPVSNQARPVAAHPDIPGAKYAL